MNGPTIWNGGLPADRWIDEKSERALHAVVAAYWEAEEDSIERAELHEAIHMLVPLRAFVAGKGEAASNFGEIERIIAEGPDELAAWERRYPSR